MTTERVPVGRCHCCQNLVYPGQERREVIETGTSVAPDVLLHQEPCHPPRAVRRHN